MSVLYVEKVPPQLYNALRRRARSSRRSIAAETISILEQMVPSRAEIERRRDFYRQIQQLRKRSRRAAAGPSAEQLLREDRER